MRQITKIKGLLVVSNFWPTAADALKAVIAGAEEAPKLTQTRLANRINKTALHGKYITQSMISDFCRGKKLMSDYHRKAIADAIPCDPEDLLDGARKLSPEDRQMRKLCREAPDAIKPTISRFIIEQIALHKNK